MNINFKILTLFPEMFPGPLGISLAGKALNKKIWSYETINIRDFATDKHASVDDTPYGGGAGMVMRPDIVGKAIDKALTDVPNSKIIYFSPRGKPLTQAEIYKFSSEKSIILLCGRFEALDQRVIDEYKVEEISVGDYILSGGEIAACVFMDACIRLIPEVLGNKDTLLEESFGLDFPYSHLLEYPQFTRPSEWKKHFVPEVLLSGNHNDINNWRLLEAEKITKLRRKDLWKKYKKP